MSEDRKKDACQTDYLHTPGQKPLIMKQALSIERTTVRSTLSAEVLR